MRKSWWEALVVAAVVVGSVLPLEIGPGAAAEEVADPVVGSTTGLTAGFTATSCMSCSRASWLALSDDARFVTYRAGERRDLWQFDRSTGLTTRITEGDRETSGFLTSPDGSSVLFNSDATDLVEGQEGGPGDVYLWERHSGTITSLSGRTPSVPHRYHRAEALSADGRYAVFSSDEPMVPGVPDGVPHLYMWDRVTREPTVIGSGGGSTEWVNGKTVGVLMSDDGRYVTYSGGGLRQWDRVTRTSAFVAGGGLGSSAVGASSDGRYVTFTSRSPGVIPEAVDTTEHVYQWDRVTDAIVAVVFEPTDTTVRYVSSDGAHVIVSGVPNRVWDRASGAVVPLAPPEAPQVWAWSDDMMLVVVSAFEGPLQLLDRSSGTLEPVSRGPFGGFTEDVMISADGGTVTWTSQSPLEVPGVSRWLRIPYQWDRSSGEVIALVAADDHVYVGAQTADGSTALLASAARDLDDVMIEPGSNGYIWQRDLQPRRPAAPRIVARPEEGNRSITVDWEPPVPNGSGPIVGYDVEASSSAEQTGVVTVDAETTSTTIADLTNGTSYRVRVRARTSDGPGPWSARSLGATPIPPPDPPVLVSAIPGDRSARVSWHEPPGDGGSSVESYEVQPLVDGLPSGPPVETDGPFPGWEVTGLDNGTPYRFVVRARNAGGWSDPSEPSAEVTPVPPGPTFVPVTPCRVLDTRTTGGPVRPVAPRPVRITEAGTCDVPADAISIEATVTAVSPAGNGYLRAYPSGLDTPTATFVNFTAGLDATNTGAISITPGPAASTGMELRSYGSATHVVVDVQGYYRQPPFTPEGSLFVAATPCRAYDSRRAEFGARPLSAGAQRDLELVARPGCAVPVDAVAVEAAISAVDAPGSGFLRVWPAGRTPPTATFLTRSGGRSTTNTGAIAIRPGGGHTNLSVRNYGTSGHYVVDIFGWYVPAPAPPANRFVAVPPCRVLDTRTAGGDLRAGDSRSVTVVGAGTCDVPPDAAAVEATITAVDPSGTGFLRVSPAGDTTPNATFLTYAPRGATTNTGAIAIRPGVGEPNLELRNYGNASHFVIDVQGWFVPTD